MHNLGWRTVTALSRRVIRSPFDGSDDLGEALPALPFDVNEFHPEFVSMRPLHVRSRDIERLIISRHGNQEADTLTLLERGRAAGSAPEDGEAENRPVCSIRLPRQ